MDISEMHRNRKQFSREFVHFRFVPTQLRDHSHVDGILGIEDFHLLSDGCRLADPPKSWEEGGMLYKSFSGPTVVNGWSIITPEGDPVYDAVAFRIEGSNDLVAFDFQPVGTAVWKFDQIGRVSYRSETIILPETRGTEFIFDPLRAPEIISVWLSKISQGVLVVSAMALAWTDRAHEGGRLLISSMVAVSACHLVAGCQLLAQLRYLQAFRRLADVFFPLSLAVVGPSCPTSCLHGWENMLPSHWFGLI